MNTIENPQPQPDGILSQAVLVVTLFQAGGKRTLDLRSFGSPEGPTNEAEEYLDTVIRLLKSVHENETKLAGCDESKERESEDNTR